MSGGNMDYKHYVFDIDGTLLDTGYAIINSLQNTLKLKYNKEYIAEELEFCLGITAEDTMKRLNLPTDEKVFQFWNQKMEELNGTIKVFDGMNDVLTRIKECNKKLGIITSESREEYEIYFKPHGIEGYFDFIVCADDTEKHKPYKEPVLKYLELADVNEKEIIYIGDSPYDMECAKNAGIDCALALWGRRSAEGIVADYYIKEPHEILKLL
jgi:HAD superfamily hydrolase (TIGR01549 family)